MSGSLTPTSQIKKTLIGIKRELENFVGVTPTYDISSTLNAKYNVASAVVPTEVPTLAYFGIGIGGTYIDSDSNLVQPYPVLQTNMDMYQPIPFRCVPVTADLSPEEQTVYRMRVRQTINGSDYWCYYLKLIIYDQARVSLTKTDPVSGLLIPYDVNYANLNPTKPTIVGGVVTPPAVEVNASVIGSLILTGAEVVESINVLFGGNLLYARITEFGFYSGQDQTITASNGSGGTISYTEAILAQLNTGYTFTGDDFSSVSRVTNYQLANGSGSLMLL